MGHRAARGRPNGGGYHEGIMRVCNVVSVTHRSDWQLLVICTGTKHQMYALLELNTTSSSAAFRS